MRAPFQILAILYKTVDNKPFYCVWHRSDIDIWQFIAGGGEDFETPLQAAKREVWEEAGIICDNVIELHSICSIPVEVFDKRHQSAWPNDLYVIPEYSFAIEYEGEIKLSGEHTEFLWLDYESAREKLKYDSNKTALYELERIIKAKNSN